MAKSKPKAIAVKRIVDPARHARVRRALGHSACAILFVGALVLGFHFMRQWVERRVVFPDRAPRIVLTNRPAWMTDFLVNQITAAVKPVGTHSAFDHQLLVDVGLMLKSNPWVKKVVQVRRAYGEKPGDTIEIDCDWRAPIALVHWQDYYWLVDGDGVKLPEQYTLRQVPLVMRGSESRRTEIRIVEGVRNPPVESGQRWPGEDLGAGLDLVKLLHGLNFADEIVRVDVSNFGGRVSEKEAQLALGTRYDTQIRWGRPINAKDFFVEVSPAQKLAYLKQVWEQFHRVDGNQPWIDIRFDKITYPSGVSAMPTARADGVR
jgi:hypothetical protein